MEKDKLILTAVASALGGALLGILFAPEKGRKTRKRIADKGDDYLREISENTEQLSQYLKNNADSIRGKTQKITEKITENYDEWTKQELYDRAKELEIEGYSQMNKAELINALES